MEEVTYLWEKLSAEERDDLLQCLLIAAPRGGEAMVEVLEQMLLCHATEEFLEEQGQAGEHAAGPSPPSGRTTQ